MMFCFKSILQIWVILIGFRDTNDFVNPGICKHEFKFTCRGYCRFTLIPSIYCKYSEILVQQVAKLQGNIPGGGFYIFTDRNQRSFFFFGGGGGGGGVEFRNPYFLVTGHMQLKYLYGLLNECCNFKCLIF